MARWSLLFQANATQNKPIQEPIVYDGLENFSFSQYEPNNINHAVGKFSLFTYDFNFCPINRKGRMSPRQKRRKIKLDSIFGAFPKNTIRTSTTKIFSRLDKSAQGNLILFSDRHYQYRRSIEWDLKDKTIIHFRTSSKIARNYKNPLFAINNIDMQTRHNLAAFKRETIAFAKNSIAMCESFTLLMAYRNFMRPKFWGTHRSDPACSKKSPAMELGFASKILTFQEFFSKKLTPTQVFLHEEWQQLYNRIDTYSRHKIATYA